MLGALLLLPYLGRGLCRISVQVQTILGGIRTMLVVESVLHIIDGGIC